jgi:hypothetical protein
VSWAGLTLVTDADLGALEPEATDSDAPWGGTTWANARAEAKRTLKIWLELDFADLPGVADRVIDVWAPDYVFTYTGGNYTDRTTQAVDDEPTDLDLTGCFTTPASDRLYIGALWQSEGLSLKLTGTRNAAASVVTVKYSGPAGWTTLTTTDGTAVAGATFGKSGRITWTVPADWQRERVNGSGDEFFWLEVSVSATLTAGVTASQLNPVRAPDGLKRCAAYLALSTIYNGLAAGSPGEERWRAQGDAYLAMARELYVALKTNRALWIDINASGVLTGEERQQGTGGGFILGRA